MGLLSFFEDGTTRPGYRIGDDVVDLTSLPTFPDDTEWDVTSHLSQLDVVREQVQSAVEMETGEKYSVDEVAVGAPICDPTLVRLDGCYELDENAPEGDPHVRAGDLKERNWPRLWTAPSSCLVAPDRNVTLPQSMADVRPGVELALVVGTASAEFTDGNVWNAIAGFTGAVTMSAHDELPGIQGYKMFDESTFLGPEIVPESEINPEAATHTISLNGERLDNRDSPDMRFSLTEIIEYVTDVISLVPGDYVLIGNPLRTSRTVSEGDQVTGDISEVGSPTTVISRRGNE